VIKISEDPKKPKKKLAPSNNFYNSENSENEGQISQAGKNPDEILPYLLSGEADDMSIEFYDQL
jgi:hypothetical protein